MDADLSGAKLSMTALSGADLSGANLTRSYLMAASVDGAKLKSVRLEATHFRSVVFDRTDLRELALAGLTLERCSFVEARGTP